MSRVCRRAKVGGILANGAQCRRLSLWPWVLTELPDAGRRQDWLGWVRQRNPGSADPVIAQPDAFELHEAEEDGRTCK